MSVEIGSKAPDFTLMNQERQPVTLSELKGQPVVLPFPAAFSSVASRRCAPFAIRWTKNKAHARCSISTDTFFALKAFQDQQHNFRS